jgi:hypothetical protein
MLRLVRRKWRATKKWGEDNFITLSRFHHSPLQPLFIYLLAYLFTYLFIFFCVCSHLHFHLQPWHTFSSISLVCEDPSQLLESTLPEQTAGFARRALQPSHPNPSPCLHSPPPPVQKSDIPSPSPLSDHSSQWLITQSSHYRTSP